MSLFSIRLAFKATEVVVEKYNVRHRTDNSNQIFVMLDMSRSTARIHNLGINFFKGLEHDSIRSSR